MNERKKKDAAAVSAKSELRAVPGTRRPRRDGARTSPIARVTADVAQVEKGPPRKRRDSRTGERGDGGRGLGSLPAPADVFAGYSAAQLRQIAANMRRVANASYLQFVACGVHALIEFNGLQQKYVDLCERAARSRIDFTQASKHGGVALPAYDHDVIYLAEKFACIFGPTFKAQPELWEIFKQVVEAER